MDNFDDMNAQERDDHIDNELIPTKKRKSRIPHDDFSKYFDTVTETVNGEEKKFFSCKSIKEDNTACGARYVATSNSSAV
jgi:hypothetical protein